MSRLRSFLLHPVTLATLGLIALSAVIWWGGPAVKFGADNRAPLAEPTARLGLIMALMVLWGLNNLRLRLRGQRADKALTEALVSSAAPDHDEPLELKERFETALETLKRYRFKGARGLYELPWYIIVGPPGSGKTTALVNSGLEFPLADACGEAALKGIGGTKNCDWWFTSDAVLIDTAGRYTTHDSAAERDRAAWQSFLALLVKHRRRRPINGALVAISCADLLAQTEDERANFARTIRARLDELQTELQLRFPVYVVFTKADLIAGFSEFFEDFSREEREQVWGVTLPDMAATAAPDFEHLKNGLDTLTARLFERTTARMQAERDPNRRVAISHFAERFDHLRGLAEKFTRQCCGINRFKHQPYLRGVYFTSGAQEGTPIDRLMTSVANDFGFGGAGQAPVQGGRSFFLTRLFSEVIFPEGEIAGSNAVFERSLRWARRGSLAAMLLLMVGATAIWANNLVAHRAAVAEIEAAAARYQAQRGAEDLLALLPALNALAEASAVESPAARPLAAGLGLYDPRLSNAAQAAYRGALERDLAPALAELLAGEVGAGNGDLYDSFRLYMMLVKPEHLEAERLGRQLDALLARRWGESETRSQLSGHAQALFSRPFPGVAPQAELVAATRAELLRLPVAERVFARLQVDPLLARPVSLQRELQYPLAGAFKVDQSALSLPYMYTRAGYGEIDLSEDSPLIRDLLAERWVLADDDSDPQATQARDLKQISDAVTGLYLAGYIAAWDGYYRALSPVEFHSLRHAEQVLALLTDPVRSPLTAALALGRAGTQLRPPATEVAAVADKALARTGKATKLAAKAALGQYQGTAVDSHFAELNGWSGAAGGLDAALAQLTELRMSISAMALAPEPGRQAFELAGKRFQSGAGNAITGVKAFAQTLPVPVRPWLEQIAEQSWKVVVGEARGFVASEWQNAVYNPYRATLAGRYPLNRASDDEAALLDFVEHFKPGGRLDQFQQTYLGPFLQRRGGLSNRVLDGYSLGLSGDFLAQLERAELIRQTFFRQSPDTPTVELALRPRAMEARDARFTLDIGGTRLSYQHGPKLWQNLSWQAGGGQRARLAFEDVNGSLIERAFDGPWAWLRLLDSALVEKTGNSSTYLVSFSAGTSQLGRRDLHTITYEVKTGSAESPLRPELLSGYRCPERL